MPNGTIYGISIISTGQIVYVGQTRQPVRERWLQHLTRDTPLARHLRANGGRDHFSLVVLETVAIESLNEREEAWIKNLGTMHPAGLNHRPGGRAKGTSQRVRMKLAERSKAMWADPNHRSRETSRRKTVWANPEYKDKMSAARKAMWADPEQRAKIVASRKGVWSDERRAKHAARMKAHWSNPEYKARVAGKISEKHKALSVEPAYRAAQTDRALKRWQSRSNQVM